ncbi:TonB-dependent receptor [uncultured Acinetobacter sp.]|uniref:TonB-dependent receptor plug domain-containing protein n=1 Tax=Acinetobacter sp. TaxID=472 RepID=UPI00260F8CCC|nr:TonB-dependent receptor [uncultured Acinetobacter sp.]
MRFSLSTLTTAILTILTTSAYANDSNEQQEKNVALLPIIVKAQESQPLGKTIYTKQDLERIPNGSKNITNFLKINPNVQFSHDHLAASAQADLKPAEISIHGAQSFQNKFVVNGVSNSNLLDPMGSGTAIYGGIAAGSQGVAINTDLLCNLEVLDSNVSAKHGGFTGGVIQAETCAPNTEIGKIHGSISYDYTESDWNRYHLTTDADQGLFAGESTQSNQKEYVRQGVSTNLYGKLSEVYAFDAYVSQRRSEVPVASGLPSPTEIEQKKFNTNIGATLYIDPNAQTKMKLGVTLGDLEDNSYVDKRRHSQSTTQNESALMFAEIDQQYGWGELKQKLNYQQIDNDRTSSSDRGVNWIYAPGSKDWSNTEQAWEGATSADIALKQHSINYELDTILNSFDLGDTKHQLSAGFAYHYDNVQWQRSKDFITHYAVTSGPTQNLYDLKGASCQANDPLCDENSTAPFMSNKVLTVFNGQYFGGGSLYKAGQFDGTYQQASLYLEDAISWNNFNARLGVRADYDEANRNLNVAPRSSIRYQPFYNDSLTFTSGWNRYYSAPTYMTDLRQSVTSLDFNLKREDQNSDWTESPKTSWNTDTQKQDLKTPYADEIVFGINSQFKNTHLGLKWVNRQYKDEISRNQIGTGVNRYTVYDNSGYGENDTITLEVNTLEPIKFKGSQHELGLAINYTDAYRSTPDYTDVLIEEELQELISYDGKIIEHGDMPASNYNQPMTARVSWDIGFDTLPLKISNFFSYKDTYEQVLEASSADKVVHNGVKIDTYTLQEIKPRFTWDMRTTYNWNITQDYSMIFGLTINNITNRNNLYASGNKQYSEIGRQFIADVSFKF